jgi:uncharacterized phage protein (TIGR02218 family)
LRTLPDGMAGEATTLARCWRLVRRDGVVAGFTDHDRDIVVDGTVHRAEAGFEAAEAEQVLGFAVGGGEIAGALVSAGIAEADVHAGLYDGATVETRLVDWTDPSRRFLLDVGTIGEVKRGEYGFIAELRSLAHRLDEPTGRLFQATCTADLGDGRCRVDLGRPEFRAEGTVAETDGRGWVTATLGEVADGRFTRGAFAFTSGDNAGSVIEVKVHRRAGAVSTFALWRPTARPIVSGDRFTVTAGCDKRIATCRAVFDNVSNFRGFPRMPGNDVLVRRVLEGEGGMDGGSLFR